MTPNRHSSRNRARWLARRAGALLAVAALLTLLAACGTNDHAATATPRAAAQPTATSVLAAQPTPAATAVPPTPTPRPTPDIAFASGSPTPLPAPQPAIGTAVATQGWEITVTDVTTYDRIGDHTANGVYLYVSLSVKNTGSNPTAFPYDGLVVVDANNASYALDVPATTETLTYDKGVDIFQQFDAGSTHAVAAAFDIPTDATGLKLTTPSRVFTIVLDRTTPTK
jgi:hypothetical protein